MLGEILGLFQVRQYLCNMKTFIFTLTLTEICRSISDSESSFLQFFNISVQMESVFKKYNPRQKHIFFDIFHR